LGAFSLVSNSENGKGITFDYAADAFARHGRKIRIGKEFIKTQKGLDAGLRLIERKAGAEKQFVQDFRLVGGENRIVNFPDFLGINSQIAKDVFVLGEHTNSFVDKGQAHRADDDFEVRELAGDFVEKRGPCVFEHGIGGKGRSVVEENRNFQGLGDFVKLQSPAVGGMKSLAAAIEHSAF